MGSPTTAAQADDSYRLDDGGRCVEAVPAFRSAAS